MVMSRKNYVSNNPLLKATSILTECIGSTKSFMGSSKLLELGMIHSRSFFEKKGFKLGATDSTLFTKSYNGDLFTC